MQTIYYNKTIFNKSRLAAKHLLLVVFVTLFGVTVVYSQTYNIEVIDRTLYGPGPFPDQKLKTAWIRNIKFEDFLKGKVTGVNNLGEAPNVTGEELQGKTIDGKLSDGTLINEDIDMSNAVIMNGQFNLLLAAVFGGPNAGDTLFYLDEKYNWWIKDDIAIDPGFPAGIVRINDFTFSTGPRIIPHSLQTEFKYPGGTNQIGSIKAGRIALGRLGDDDDDGYIDGVFNAIGRFPLNSIFLPGAPFVQLFEFKSDIPITSIQSALLSTASAKNSLSLIKEVDKNHPDLSALWERVEERMNKVNNHIKVSLKNKKDCAEHCVKLDQLTKKIGATDRNDKKQVEEFVEDAYNILKKIVESSNV